MQPHINISIVDITVPLIKQHYIKQEEIDLFRKLMFALQFHLNVQTSTEDGAVSSREIKLKFNDIECLI